MMIETIIFLAVVFGVAAGFLLERLRVRIDEAEQRKVDMSLPAISFGGHRLPALPQPDAVEKLRNVSDARFLTKKLLSDNEAIVLGEIEAIITEFGQPWRVLAQISLSQILASADAEAVSAIDGQKAALLIVNADRSPLAVVEYQPLGQVRSEDAVHDAIKREALRRAGVAYIEVRSGDMPGDLRADMRALLSRRRILSETPLWVVPPTAPPSRA